VLVYAHRVARERIVGTVELGAGMKIDESIVEGRDELLKASDCGGRHVYLALTEVFRRELALQAPPQTKSRIAEIDGGWLAGKFLPRA
jgi:hypothetical protein